MAPAALPAAKVALGTDCRGEFVGLRAAVDDLQKRKICGPEGRRIIIARSHSPHSQYRILHPGSYKIGKSKVLPITGHEGPEGKYRYSSTLS